MSEHRFHITLAGLLVLLAGCQSDPYADRYTTKMPKNPDLLGTYALTPESANVVRAKGGSATASSRIIIRRDGVILFQDVPDLWLDSPDSSNRGLLSASGTWGIQRRQDQWWALFVDVRERGISTEIPLIGDKPPYTLHFILGDPDAGEAIQFVRVAK